MIETVSKRTFEIENDRRSPIEVGKLFWQLATEIFCQTHDSHNNVR